MDVSEDQKSLLSLALAVSAVMLVLAVPPIWPYGYYMLLRLIVCATAIFGVVIAYAQQWRVRAIVKSVVAVLFNPIIPVYLSKKIWSVIDLIVAIYFVVICIQLRRAGLRNQVNDDQEGPNC